MRESVDLIIVSYQTVSWRGKPADPNLLDSLRSMKKRGLIDEIIEFSEFEPNSGITQSQINQLKRFELAKRQQCLALAKSLGATHYLSMDADEFYRKSEFEAAKSLIIKDKLDATAIRYINYITPTLHRGYARWLVPFIYRITDRCEHSSMQNIFFGVDPTRGIFDPLYRTRRVLDPGLISMHHMEMVRRDIKAKYESSSRHFPRIEGLDLLARDIETAQKTGSLRFSGLHLGDYDDPRETRKLTQCKNEFGIDF